MEGLRILVVGAGIGGLTAAIALGRDGHAVDVIERESELTVYGVGIIQQANVVRAMTELGLIDDYLAAGFGYDHVSVFAPDGRQLARIPSPRLVPDRPANVGISRAGLHKVLESRAKSSGASITLGATIDAFEDKSDSVWVRFNDRREEVYDLVVGADGLRSQLRQAVMPDAPHPEFTGQAVWRYNFERSADVENLCAYEGEMGIGLVPLSDRSMYLFLTSPEPGNPKLRREGLAREMRERLAATRAPAIAALADRIVDDAAVVYRPLEWLFVDGPWHRGRVVLIGDAVHTTTPHLGQGAGMAIEDAIVLAEELRANDAVEEALRAYGDRRLERCRYVVEASLAICRGQLGEGPRVDAGGATREMFERMAEPL